MAVPTPMLCGFLEYFEGQETLELGWSEPHIASLIFLLLGIASILTKSSNIYGYTIAGTQSAFLDGTKVRWLG